MLCRVRRGTRALLVAQRTRTGRSDFRRWRGAPSALPARRARWLDGEVAVLLADGTTSFQALQNALTPDGAGRAHVLRLRPAAPRRPRPAHRAALEERKRALKALLGAPAACVIRYSDHVDRRRCALPPRRLPARRSKAIVSQAARRALPAPGAAPAWLKIKCCARQELVIGGFTEPAGRARRPRRAAARRHDDERGARVRRARWAPGSRRRAAARPASPARGASSATPARSRPGRARAAGRPLRAAASWSPRCASPSGRATGSCGTRRSWACARTSPRARWCAKRPMAARSRRADGRGRRCAADAIPIASVGPRRPHQERPRTVLRAASRTYPAAPRGPSALARPLSRRARRRVLLLKHATRAAAGAAAASASGRGRQGGDYLMVTDAPG